MVEINEILFSNNDNFLTAMENYQQIQEIEVQLADSIIDIDDLSEDDLRRMEGEVEQLI